MTSPSLVIENSLPGVIAIVNAGQVSRPVERQPSSTFFAVGYSPWGPVNTPTVVTGWADYVRQFGPFDVNSFLDDAAYTFFNTFPGKTMVAVRVVGAAKALATLSLKDQSAGAGLNTLRVDAKYPSTLADILVTVAVGTAADTFKLTVRSVFLKRTEIHDNLTLSDATMLTRVNQKSSLINVTDLANATASPNDNPRALAEAALAGGGDDFAGLVAASYVGTDDGTTRSGLQALKDEQLGTGQVAIPGLTTTAVHAALVAHGEAYHRTAFPDPPLGSDKAAVAAIRALYGTWYAALYWPWVQMLDYAGSGTLKYYPPSAFAAGACAQVDRTIGVHKAPANIEIPGALDVERNSAGASQTDDNTREYLNGKDVNVITPLPQQGVKIYGARVMTGDRRVSFVHQIRLLNEFYYAAKLAYGWAVFQVIDGGGKLFRALRSTGQDFLRSFYEAGALFGKKEEEAFLVTADENNNPSNELETGIVHVQWGVRISPTSERIVVNIDNVPLTQDLGVLQQ
jgi:phage tail sheath protein FI